MATGNTASPAVQQVSISSPPQNGESPQALRSWWKTFKQRSKKESTAPVVQPPQGIFGVPLEESIKYANVAISLMNEQGQSFIYGYVPIVVAKCGVFLKEKATDVEGIFRLSGSAKRIKELQAQFDSPTRYGKGLDWTGYTVHDAANVLRRYLNQLPQPIVPLNSYEQFRDPLRNHQSLAAGDADAQAANMGDLDLDKAIVRFQQLIKELPPLNRQLLLYILDLLSVFASKADLNRMTSANLAAIFQPGMLSHPQHDMSPPDYRLSQDVIIFLIDNQDSFLIGMNGTAADEKTVRELQSEGQAQQVTTPTKATHAGLGRSASNASGGADRISGMRRNISASSKNSKNSSNLHTPNTPSSGVFAASSAGGGVHRSNTLPSKRSPALSSTLHGRGLESPTTPIALGSPSLAPPARSVSPALPASKLAPATTTSDEIPQPIQFTPLPTTSASKQPSIDVTPAPVTASKERSQENPHQGDNPYFAGQEAESNLQVEAMPPKSTRISGFLAKSPTNDSKDSRQPNKLKKRRGPNSTQASANSSTNSLQQADDPTPSTTVKASNEPTASQIPGKEASVSIPAQVGDPSVPLPANNGATRGGEAPEDSVTPTALESSQRPSDSTLKAKSPTGSVRSKSSVTDLSEHDQTDQTNASKPERKRRWRFSSAAKHNPSPSITSPRLLGTNGGAGVSASSVGSGQKAQKSTSNEVPPAPLDSVASIPTQQSSISDNSVSKEKELQEDSSERKGIFGRFKAKVTHSKDERKEKEAEKERAKSPLRDDAERHGSKQSLSAMAHDNLPLRGGSIDAAGEQQTQEPANIVSEPKATAP